MKYWMLFTLQKMVRIGLSLEVLKQDASKPASEHADE